MTVTLQIWLLIYGAIAGLAGAYAARGRNRLFKAAIVGAVGVLLVDLARGLL